MWRRYLAGWSIDLPTLQANEAWILSYLRLRQGAPFVRTPKQLEQWLEQTPPKGLENTFYVEWYRIIGKYAFDNAAFKLAQRAFVKAAAIAPAASKDFFNQEARRAEFSSISR
jgi:hypothetical protein